MSSLLYENPGGWCASRHPRGLKQHLQLRTIEYGSIDAAGFRIKAAERACSATVDISDFLVRQKARPSAAKNSVVILVGHVESPLVVRASPEGH